jgi:hypothetical protein
MTKSDNELIAEFMGWEHCNSPSCIENNNLCWSKDCHSGYVSKDKLKFETSWDWLMPVVEKIFDTEFGGKFEEWKSLNRKISESLSVASLDGTYKAVVAFIHWYNSQKVNPVTV